MVVQHRVQFQPDEPLELSGTQAASLRIDVNGSGGVPEQNTHHHEKNGMKCLPPYAVASGHAVFLPRTIRWCPNGARCLPAVPVVGTDLRR
jgi:hypothetical protein